MRCKHMGASCVKFEPPLGDPMLAYSPAAYGQLHTGVRVVKADLKTEAGQRKLHLELAKTDVLLTSFRPSVLQKLGLAWLGAKGLHKLYPQLNLVSIVGAPGARAKEPGHDLTYMAENDLVQGLNLPASLYADMAGSLAAVEAVLQAVLLQRGKGKGNATATTKGVHVEVALSEAAAYIGLPRTWGLTKSGAAVGGGHAGYRVYVCKDGRVAVAALEPHFAASLCALVGIKSEGLKTLLDTTTHQSIEAWMASKTRQQLEALAVKYDIPLHTML